MSIFVVLDGIKGQRLRPMIDIVKSDIIESSTVQQLMSGAFSNSNGEVLM